MLASSPAVATGDHPSAVPHLETFGGCLLGQIVPPSLLVAVSVLEAMFFVEHGIRSVSLSYAQQINENQDEEALAALRCLAEESLLGVDWHIVLYTYMGLFPQSRAGAERLLVRAAALAVRCGTARLIVKTVAEAHRIPTAEENVAALELAARVAADEATASRSRRGGPGRDSQVYAEARAMVDAVRELALRIGPALALAFARGILDVPFCLHPDNAGRTASYVDGDGRIVWSDTGRLPIDPSVHDPSRRLSSTGLLQALTRVRCRFDEIGRDTCR
jgi:methylaspartate mutase epsilon subunit